MARGRKSTTAAQEPIQEEVKEEVKEEIKEEPKKVEKPVKENDEVAELKRQLAEMKELLKQATEAKQAPVIQMTQQESERVHFLFEAEVAEVTTTSSELRPLALAFLLDVTATSPASTLTVRAAIVSA